MSRLTLFRVGFLFLILFFTTTAKAQKEAETFNVDSTLYEYTLSLLSMNIINVVKNTC